MRIKRAIERLPWPTLKPPVQTTSLFFRVKKGVRPAEGGPLASVFEKLAAGLKLNKNY